MQINKLSQSYGVSAQISPLDAPTIAQAGYKSVICNRPDSENAEANQILAMHAAVEGAGLKFAEHPFSSGNFDINVIERQSELLDNLPGPVLAYCATGTRCSVVWAFVQAKAHTPVAEILAATTNAGYQLTHLAPQLISFGAKED